MNEPILVDLLELDKVIEDKYKMSCEGKWDCLDICEILSDLGAHWISQAIRETFLINCVNYGKVNEKDVYKWFKQNYKNELGEKTQIIQNKNNPHHQPDLWVLYNGKKTPVECKLRDFNENALQQLQRYMKFYGSAYGVAVGERLVCDIPQNIVFVKHAVI